ncbi:MAG TPA: type II toxin-antitoxin system Phd/YefM family antitoxin [Anaeromyxobacteraceae bacterium]|nr:type II toxin-antitoxin system Phd/YefM family antitoxin [Anaeromyxobacteraceae bacterium]
MSSARRIVPAAQFKARCLAILDEVDETKETVVVTKRGRAVARVVAAEPSSRRPLRGSVRWHGDLVAPLDEGWDVER